VVIFLSVQPIWNKTLLMQCNMLRSAACNWDSSEHKLKRDVVLRRRELMSCPCRCTLNTAHFTARHRPPLNPLKPPVPCSVANGNRQTANYSHSQCCYKLRFMCAKLAQPQPIVFLWVSPIPCPFPSPVFSQWVWPGDRLGKWEMATGNGLTVSSCG